MIEQKVGVLADRLIKRGWTVTTAESCTGGGVAAAMTEQPGSSAWFHGAFVTYSNAMKEGLLGVSGQTLAAHGAVSEPVVKEMAEGARLKAGANLAVAISGIAGPGGGSEAKPVGTVCFAWVQEGKSPRSETRRFSGDRHQVREAAIEWALQGLLDEIV